MNIKLNNEVVPNSNPASPSEEFIVDIPLDEEFINEQVPEPDTYYEVNTLQSESSESDFSSYSLNYDSDSSDGRTVGNGPIYPNIPIHNYPNDKDHPEDITNWV